MPNLFDVGTNKQGLIVYGGESSTDYGIVVSEAPAFDKGKKKIQTFNVPGRNGAVIFNEGSYEDTTRNYKVWVAKDREESLPEIVDAMSSWLYSKSGYVRLEDSFEPDVFRLAYYVGGQEVTNRMLQFGETTLPFICRAERFFKDAEQEQIVSNGDAIYNPTRYESKPLIHIEGSGSVSISIQGVTMTATISDYINIDSDRMNAYRLPSENKNNTISGTFPTIKAGTNTIATTGTVTKVTIVPRYFTI